MFAFCSPMIWEVFLCYDALSMWKSEAEFQGSFTSWVRGGGFDSVMAGCGGVAYELKLVRGWKGERGMKFSALPDHELRSLCLAGGERGHRAWNEYVRLRGGEVVDLGSAWILDHKISDSALGYKPCDGFVIGGSGGRGLLIVAYEYGGVGGREVWAIDGWRYIEEVFMVKGGRGSMGVEDVRGSGGIALPVRS